jgi:caspase domain-containing protein
MKRGIRTLCEKTQNGGIGLFYFAGHGIQVNGKNFLIPVGVTINHEDEVEDESVDLDFLLGQMLQAQNRLNIVILDACRNNPFARSFRSTSRGLAHVNAPQVNASRGTLIAYATAPGDIASDGDRRNSPYTEELLKYIKEANLKIEEVFKRVRVAVLNKTAGKQRPWESLSIVDDFYFLEKREPNIAVSPIPNTTNLIDTKSSDIPESEAPPRETIVLVADFKSLNEQGHAVTETIIDQLRDSTKKYNDIQIQALGESITAQQGPEVARIKGRERKARIVLWGWYSKTNEKVIINVHFEVLQKPTQLFLSQDKHTFILPSGELESFNIQLRLSSELTYLTLLTIGLARLDIEDYDSAIEHFSNALAQASVPKEMINPGDIYFYRGCPSVST